MSVTVKYSFSGAFLVELQWHVDENNIAVGLKSL